MALLVGDDISPYDAGEIWHLFDTRYDMTITKLDTKTITNADLNRYNTIIIPSSQSLDSSKIEKLKTWTKNRGTIVAYENTAKWLKENELISFELIENDVEARDITFEQKDNFKGSQVIGGAIFETKLDRSHLINFVYKAQSLPIFKKNTIFIKPDSLSYNNPIK